MGRGRDGSERVKYEIPGNLLINRFIKIGIFFKVPVYASQNGQKMTCLSNAQKHYFSVFIS